MTHTPVEPDPTPDPGRTPTVAGWPPVETVHPAASSTDSGSVSGSGSGSGSAVDTPADTAKAEASDLENAAAGAGRDLAETAKSETRKVAGETKRQASTLLAAANEQVSAQASTQQHRLADAVNSWSGERSEMASGSSQSGPVTDLARQAGERGGQLASWLQDHEPRDVLREVQTFARRRPVTFLVLCGAAGVVAGRLTRGAVAANTDLDSGSSPSAPSDSTRSAPPGPEVLSPELEAARVRTGGMP